MQMLERATWCLTAVLLMFPASWAQDRGAATRGRREKGGRGKGSDAGPGEGYPAQPDPTLTRSRAETATATCSKPIRKAS